MSGEIEKITELEELINALENADESEIPFIVSNISLDASALEKWASFSDEKYTRNKLRRTEKFELMVLGWTPRAMHSNPCT